MNTTQIFADDQVCKGRQRCDSQQPICVMRTQTDRSKREIKASGQADNGGVQKNRHRNDRAPAPHRIEYASSRITLTGR